MSHGHSRQLSKSTAVADTGGVSLLDKDTLGWDPGHYTEVRIQVTGMSGGTGMPEALGPAGTYDDLVSAALAEDEIVVVTGPFGSYRVTFSGSGTATIEAWD